MIFQHLIFPTHIIENMTTITRDAVSTTGNSRGAIGEDGDVSQGLAIHEERAQRKVELHRTNIRFKWHWHQSHGVSMGVNLLHGEFLWAHLNGSVFITTRLVLAGEVELVTAAAVTGSVLPPEKDSICRGRAVLHTCMAGYKGSNWKVVVERGMVATWLSTTKRWLIWM